MILGNTDTSFMRIILAVVVAMVIWYVLYRALVPVIEALIKRWHRK
jgi:hypothetical protein